MQKLALLLTLLVPALALAQPAKGAPVPAKADTKAVAPVPPAPPAPPPEVKATVDAFKGNWKFDITLTATGIPGMDKPFNGKMTFNCKPAAGNTAVACDAKSKTPMGPFEGVFVVAYDPYSKAAHFMAVTNQHEVHDHVCKWSDYALNCAPLKAGMGPAGDEITEDVSMTFESTKKKACSGADAVGGTAACVAACKGAAPCEAKCQPFVRCPPDTVSFKSSSKMTKGGATIVFEGKGKK